MPLAAFVLTCLAGVGHGDGLDKATAQILSSPCEDHQANHDRPRIQPLDVPRQQLSDRQVGTSKPLEVLVKLFRACSPASGWQAAGIRCGHRAAANSFIENSARAHSVVLNSPNDSVLGNQPAVTSTMQIGNTVHADVEAMSTEDRFKYEKDKLFDDFGKLVELFKDFLFDTREWELEELKTKKSQIIELYVRCFATVVTFDFLEFAGFATFFAIFFALLSVSPFGFSEISEKLSGVPLLGDALGKLDPAFGNLGLAFLLTDITEPIIFGVAMSQTPKYTEMLNNKLTEWGLDAEGLDRQLEDLADFKSLEEEPEE